MSNIDQIFLESLKKFHADMSQKDWDETSAELLFAKFLSNNWDKNLLDNETVLHKITLVCEEFEIDIDNVIKIFLQ